MFSAIFEQLSTISGTIIRWHHVEHMRPSTLGTIQAITCDMDTKQARGKHNTIL